MHAVPPRVAPRVRHDIAPSAILVVVAIVSAAVSIAIHQPVISSQPIFALVNGAVTCTLTTLGTYLALSERERFTGVAFMIAGITYPLADIDIFPGWGPYLSYLLGGGALFYGSLSWGILRYGRQSLNARDERAFIPVCLVLTSGSGLLAALFARPEWLGFPTGTPWFTVWPDHRAFGVASVVVCLGFVAVACYFTLLMIRRIQRTPLLRRGSLLPLSVFGSGLAIGAAVIDCVVTLAPTLVALHTLLDILGILTLSVAAALVVGIVRHRLLAARAIEQLPSAHTPETVNQYVRQLLQDETAELLYWSPDTQSLIDSQGLRPTMADEHDPSRLRSWITGNDGSRVAMLTCRAEADGAAMLGSIGRVLALVADNARLNVLLRMRVAQLTATRTAEQLASMKAHEQFQRNLHDGVQQTIASIRLDIDGLYDVAQDDASRSLVAAAMDKLGTALDQIRNLKSGSSPPELRFGLKPAVERTVAELRLDAHVDIPDADLGVLTMPAYYIVRECLTNIHKHADACRIKVRIATDGRMLTIRVDDDGIGGATPRVGGGLAGVRDRVRDLSGTLQLESTSGIGTSVEARIPHVS